MPRIIRITPEMAGVPATAPLARMSPTASGWGAAAQATAGLAHTVQQAGGELLRIQGALQAEDAKLDMQEQFNKLKYNFALREIEIREGLDVPQPGPTSASDMNGGVGQPSQLDAGPELLAGPPPDPTAALAAGPAGMMTALPAMIQAPPQPTTRPMQPKDYAEKYGTELDKMVDESAKGLKYPGMERVYRAHIAPYVGAQKIEALNRGIKLQHAAMIVKDDLAAREEEQVAITGATPEVRQAAFNSRVDRIARFVESGLMSGDQGKAALQQTRHNVDRGSAIRDYANPEKRDLTVGKLLGGQWSSSMTYEEQTTLARTLSDQDDAKRRQREADAEKTAKKEYNAAVSYLYDQALTKRLTEGEYTKAVTDWQLTREDQKALRDAMAAETPEPPSDVAVRDYVTARVESINPKITEGELNQLREARKLNFKDWQTAMNQLRSTRFHLISESKSDATRYHNQAEQELFKGLGIPTLYDKLDPLKEKALALALPELRRRSNAFAGRENPITVVEEILPRYQRMLDSSAAVTVDQVERVLKVPDQKALDAARIEGKITGSDYDTQRRLLMQRDEALRQRQLREAGTKLQQDLQKALGKGTKKPGGTTGVKPD